MKTKPYGMVDCEINQQWFDPSKPVKPCFFGVDGVGDALGFTQNVKDQHPTDQSTNRFYGAVFVPRLRPLLWRGGDIDWRMPKLSKERAKSVWARFDRAFQAAFGVEPIIEGMSSLFPPMTYSEYLSKLNAGAAER